MTPLPAPSCPIYPNRVNRVLLTAHWPQQSRFSERPGAPISHRNRLAKPGLIILTNGYGPGTARGATLGDDIVPSPRLRSAQLWRGRLPTGTPPSPNYSRMAHDKPRPAHTRHQPAVIAAPTIPSPPAHNGQDKRGNDGGGCPGVYLWALTTAQGSSHHRPDPATAVRSEHAPHDQNAATRGSIVSPLGISFDGKSASVTSVPISTLRPTRTLGGTIAFRPTMVIPVLTRFGSSQFGV